MKELLDKNMIVQTKPGTVPQRKLYLDEGKGVSIQSLWDDIEALSASAKERLGYPTQKPEALLDRIIQVSSNEGDTVLDPFCGCGTTIASAQRLHRRWVGIDITNLAITLIRHRLQDAYGKGITKQYKVFGEPVSAPDAAALAEQDRYQFQWWALGLVGARPTPLEQKKGADKGIDGRLYFFDDLPRQMRAEAASTGNYESPFAGHKAPRLQILTVEQLLAGKGVDMPPHENIAPFGKRAPRAKMTDREGHRQAAIPFDEETDARDEEK